MSKALSLHVGVNQVSSTVFNAPPLKRCEADATEMFELAKRAGFEPDWKSPTTGKPSLLLGTDASYDNVVKAVADAALALEPGGIFLFTFAGHGTSSFLDEGPEPNGPNETIVLTDHMLFDEVWRNHLWPLFNKPGMRAVTIADCCNAGGVFSDVDFLGLAHLFGMALKKVQTMAHQAMQGLGLPTFGFRPGSEYLVRQISDDERLKELNKNREFYERETAAPAVPKVISVRRLLLSACDAEDKALEGPKHGVFTQAILDALSLANIPPQLNLSTPPNRYDDLISVVKNLVSLRGFSQKPGLRFEGPDPSFAGERPFSP